MVRLHISDTVRQVRYLTGASKRMISPKSSIAIPSSEASPDHPILSRRSSLSAALKEAHPLPLQSLGTLLAAAGVVNDRDVHDALAQQKTRPKARLGDLLVEAGKLTDRDLYQALAEQMGLPFVELRNFDVEPEALALLPQELVRAHRVLPLMIHDGQLVVATDDPANSDSLSALRFRAQRPINPVLATPVDLDEAIAKHYPPFDEDALLANAEQARTEREQQAGLSNAEQLASQKPIVRLVNNLLLSAVQRRASDVHLRPRERTCEARYRIDGTLVQVGEFNPGLTPAVVARIKVLAGMDVAEHRLPQDGAIHMGTSHGDVDLRVSVMPAVFGENVVVRILDRNVGLRRLAQVGFQADDERRLRSLLERNQGMVLVTGPTGSGKTTTLYAALAEFNNGEYQIVTVEDPVEYRVDGLVQVQAQPAIGYGFPEALRHILRHDPDIILIGEIRDEQTAKIAIESALTGHLVLSTLHTNSAVQTITRLLEIGIPPYLVNATLAGVLAQRLARRNCTVCKSPEEVSGEVRALLGIDSSELFWRGKGCDACLGTGYMGRIATYELMHMSYALREMVRAGLPHDQLEEQAIKEGMVPLTTQALALARAGTISLDEVLRVRLG